MITVSCIICAHNEAERIGNILRVVSVHPLIDEIIVVDDGSADNTAEIASGFERVKLIVHTQNQGKSAALYTGLKEAKGRFIILLDADLLGLTQENITSLLEPVLKGAVDISISYRGNSPMLWRIIHMDFLSGERVFPRALLEEHLDKVSSLRGFGFEVFLNTLIIQNRYRIKIVSWPNVQNPSKSKKYGRRFGFKGALQMVKDIFSTISIFQMFYQIGYMMKLRVK